jgi:hypothetical protein
MDAMDDITNKSVANRKRKVVGKLEGKKNVGNIDL